MAPPSPSPDPAPAASEAVLSVQRSERQRIAQLLHDTVSQSLTGAYLRAVMIAEKLRRNGAEGTDEVARLADMLQQVAHELRAVVGQLDPQEGEASTADKEPPANR